MNIIKYNNKNIPYPTPFVTLNQGNVSFNRNWGKDTTINLEGQLTGDYENIRRSQSGLLNIFNQNFGKFEIYEGAEKIYEKSGIIIRSINFNESPYATLLGYNIELNSLEFSGNVTDPRNQFSFTENKDKTITLNHSISARGLNTNTNSFKSNALQNAIDFVRTYTGLSSIPTLKFISGLNSRNFYLQNFSESIDRLNGVYSIDEEYQASLLNTGLSGNLSYTIDISSGANSNFLEINVRGTYKGTRNGDINQLRNSLNITGLITGNYNGYFNTIPLQYNLSENTGENSISFDYSFDNINLPNPYFRYTTSVSRNALEQVCNVQVQGEMIARGNLKYRSSLINSNTSTLTNSFFSVASGALSGFKDLNNLTINSPLRFKNMTINKNVNEGKLTATADYDDKYMPSGYFLDAAYSVSVEAPRWYMSNVPTCNIYGSHVINDFDITTLPKLNMNVNAKMNIESAVNERVAKTDIKNIANTIIPTNYNFNVKLKENENITKKYYNLNSASEISYSINKVATGNQNGLLPKFNTL
jgi:hypothetical protein